MKEIWSDDPNNLEFFGWCRCAVPPERERKPLRLYEYEPISAAIDGNTHQNKHQSVNIVEMQAVQFVKFPGMEPVWVYRASPAVIKKIGPKFFLAPKVIFLDMDGVMNCSSRPPDPATRRAGFFEYIDPVCVDLLNEITDTDDRICLVISSTWRITNTFSELTKMFMQAGIRARIISTTRHGFDPDAIIALGSTRGSEIQSWLKDHPWVEEFVILDDDESAGIGNEARFLRTTWARGLTPVHVRAAKEKLASTAR